MLLSEHGLGFVHVGSDSAYLNKPVKTNHVFLGTSEIADVVVDFAESSSDTVILENSAAYPYPSGSAQNDLTEFTNYMVKLKNATQCDLAKHAVGKSVEIPAEEQGWKNVFKMKPGFVTKIFITYTYIHTNASYPFDATAGPYYIYHCHILDHEDNVMARPLKLIA